MLYPVLVSDQWVEESPSSAQAANVATTSTGNIDAERTQVKRVFIFCIPTFVCISFNLNINLLYLFRSFAVVRTHAVDVAEGKNVVAPAVKKICIVATSVHVGQKNFVVKIKNKVPSVRLMLTLDVQNNTK